MSDPVELPQLVLCVPGPWEDRSQFVEELVRGTDGQYIFAGRLLMHVPTKHVFELDFQSRDDRMLSAFSAAGSHWRDSPEMSRIDSHRSVAYLLGHGESDVNVRALMLAARGLLDAGGLGVKVESSGLAHAPAAWHRMCAEFHLFSLYRAFVVVVTRQSEAYSCGMHTFGLRDAHVIGERSSDALQVARTFSWYLFTERPEMREGQTFSCDSQSPVYRIRLSGGPEYEPGSLFINPYGTWQLLCA